MKKNNRKGESQRKREIFEEKYGNDEHNESYERYSTELTSYAQTSEETNEKPKKRKLTRKERKAEAKAQAEYEKELVKEGKIAPRYRYVPRNNFTRIVSVCVAFFIGFFAAFGVLVGGLALFGNKKKIKDITQIANFDYTDVFTEYTAELSALDFITELVNKIKNSEIKALSDVAVYTPFAEKLAEEVVGQINDAGISAEKEELMNTPFSELGSWIQDKVSEEFSTDKPLGDFLTIDESSPRILQSLKDTPINELGNKVNTLTLSDFMDEDALNGNKILKNLKNSTLDTLSSDVQSLSVEQVFGEEMYSYLSVSDCGGTYEELVAAYAENRKDEANSEKVPRAVAIPAGDTIVSVQEGETVRYFLSSDTERTNELDRFLGGTWYLLFGEGTTDMPILEMSSNVGTVIEKVNRMTLWELYLHGIIQTNPFRALTIPFGERTNLNELTITGLIDYVKQLP